MDTTNKYISCVIMGGLGNQLFQIFTVFGFALKNGWTPLFPYSEKTHLGLQRNTYWSSFLKELHCYTTNHPECKITNQMLQNFPRVNEQSFRYKEIIPFSSIAFMLNGYYQSYYYFKDVEQVIFQKIKLTQQQNLIRTQYQGLLQHNGKKVICMHFRLGDYVNIQHCHPLMNADYYNKALKHIFSKEDMSNCVVLYFCQKGDTQMVSILTTLLQADFLDLEFIPADNVNSDWEEMLLMSCCDHYTIGNSTFSWWGAYFNQNSDENKIICYPSKWFGPGLPHNTVDLFPPSWNKIECNL